MPEDAARIHDICDAKSPRLQGWRFRCRDAEAIWEIERFDMRPPHVEIVNHKLHHEVVGPLFLEVALQDKPTRVGLEDRNLTVENLFKAQCFVETLRKFKILCGNEGTYQLCA